MENEGAKETSTGFTSIEMVHTHAPQKRGFLEDAARSRNLWSRNSGKYAEIQNANCCYGIISRKLIAIIVRFRDMNQLVGGVLLSQAVCHDAKVDAQICQRSMINTVCLKISQCSGASIHDLLDQCRVSLPVGFNDGG